MSSVAEIIGAIWVAGKGGKLLTLLVAGSVATFGSGAIPDMNLVLNATMLIVAVVLAIPIAKDRRKNQTIQTQNDLIDALTKDTEAKEQTLRNLEQGAQHLKTDLAAAEARYEEVQKYTAKDSVERFEGLLTAQTVTLGQIAVTLEAMRQKMYGLDPTGK